LSTIITTIIIITTNRTVKTHTKKTDNPYKVNYEQHRWFGRVA
jgi:hypothetical protein